MAWPDPSIQLPARTTTRNELVQLSEREYFADDVGVGVPTLSASIANTLVMRSEIHAWLEHPKLGGKAQPSTKAQDNGTIVHGLLLGTGRKLCVIDADSFKSKAAQSERAEAYLRGEVAVLADDLARLEKAAAIIRGKLEKRGIVLDGESELVALWTEQSPLGPVQCRGRLDHLRLMRAAGRACIVDLKFWRSAHLDDIEKDVDEHGSHVQATAYVRAIEAIFPDLAGRVEYRWVFAELEEPYCVTVAEPDGELQMVGDAIWSSAVVRWARCLQTGRWAEYDEGIARIGAKPWTVKRAMRMAGAAE